MAGVELSQLPHVLDLIPGLNRSSCRFIWILQKNTNDLRSAGENWEGGAGGRGIRALTRSDIKSLSCWSLTLYWKKRDSNISFCASFVWQHIHHWLILLAATLVVFNLFEIEIHWNIYFCLCQTQLSPIFQSFFFVFFRSPTNINLPKSRLRKLTKGISTNHLSYISQAHLPTTACLRSWTTHIPFLKEWGIYAGKMFYSPDHTVFGSSGMIQLHFFFRFVIPLSDWSLPMRIRCLTPIRSHSSDFKI